ncbi:MAG: hypothetical protein AMXMBFR64_27930 [Myxococcales bacterium]
MERMLCLAMALVGCGGEPATTADIMVTLPFDVVFAEADAGAQADTLVLDAVASDLAGGNDEADTTLEDQDTAAPADTGTTDAGTPPKQCTPGALQCTGAKHREKCTQDGHWTTTDGCALATACHPPTGTCAPVVCEPQSSQCASSFATQKCLPSGTGWEAAHACPAGVGCKDGKCFDSGCLSRALLLVDASSSMGVHWETVQASIQAVIAANPKATFGLLPFPSEAKPCTVSGTPAVAIDDQAPDAVGAWFQTHPPFGQTPLVDALAAVAASAGAIFGPGGGSLVVISDGADTCAFPLEADPIAREAKIVAALTDSTSALLESGVQTWVVGYAYEGSTGQLDAIAEAGGTPAGTWLPAGTEQELTVALKGIARDLKTCLAD